MASTLITNLTSKATLAGTEEIPLNDAGSDKKGTVSAVRAVAAATSGTATGLTGLAIRDTSAAFDVTIAATSSTVLDAARTLTVDVVNASKTIKLGGNLTTAGALITAGAFSQTLTATGTTAVTLPTTGTLATLAGAETLTNKILTAPTATAAIITPKVTAAAGDGAITIASGIVSITKASAAALTLAAPSSVDGTRITITSTTNFAHIVTFTGSTLFDGTTGANITATFPAFKGASITVIASGVTWLVESINAVVVA